MNVHDMDIQWILAYGDTPKAQAAPTLQRLMMEAVRRSYRQQQSLVIAQEVLTQAAARGTDALGRGGLQELRNVLRFLIDNQEDQPGLDSIRTLLASLKYGADCVSFAVAASAVYAHMLRLSHLPPDFGVFRFVGTPADPHQHVYNLLRSVSFDGSDGCWPIGVDHHGTKTDVKVIV